MSRLHGYYSRRLFTKKALSWVGSLAASSLPRSGSSPFSSASHRPGRSEGFLPETLKAFAAVDPIDVHVQVYTESRLWNNMSKTLRLHVLNICVVDKHERGFGQAEFQQREALSIFRHTHGQAAWCSTFDADNFESPDFATTSIRLLNKTFEEGAVAVKVYKNIGMELRAKSGRYVMPDDPVFTPIFTDILLHNRTMVAHIAEPTASWLPLDPASPNYEYYKTYPDWHMYLHPDRPSKAAILAARDRLLASNPKLRVIGAHLGSMELDVDEIARRFERYPKFAVDTAERVPYLMLQSREKVRAFMIRYQDRVLYGTDLELMPWDNPATAVEQWRSQYEKDWKFFATDENLEYKGRKVVGLKLPESVLRNLYHNNALRWIPGILAA
jgi:hypothetical protein